MAQSHQQELDITAHDGSSAGLRLGGTLVTATASEINKVDGVAASATQLDERTLNVNVTLGTGATRYVPIPWDGDVTAAYSAINGTLTTDDETITLQDSTGTTMTGGTITITQSGSAAGDEDSATPTANNSFAAGQAMRVVIGGENGTASTAELTFTVQIT